MTGIVNLRAARKAKARKEAESKASANRAAFGRSKSQKKAEAEAIARRDRALDGARRED